MSSVSQPSSLVPLPQYWAEDEIEQGDDGYLRLKTTNHQSSNDVDDGTDVLLLHSTERVLRVLKNPESDDWKSTLFEEGWRDMTPPATNAHDGDESGDEEDDDQDESSTKEVDDPYQSLRREGTLNSRLQAAMHDIQQCRQKIIIKDAKHDSSRKDGDDDDNGKQSDDNSAMDDDDNVDEVTDNDDDGDEDEEEHDVDNGDDKEDGRDVDADETELVRMIRTLNSIRALFPHLIPMLLHKRRNDHSLQINGTKWKRRKRKAMCWMLGKYVFDTSSNHACITMHTDLVRLLKGYMTDALADKVASDPQGSLEFWKTEWIPQVKKRMTPQIMMNPLDALLLSLSEKNGNEDEDTITKNAQLCDQAIFATEAKVDKETFAKRRIYRLCIDNLRDHLLKSLKKRFPKARLTMYGSCLSNLSLGGSDVDLSLWIPEANAVKTKRQSDRMDVDAYQREMKKIVFKVFHFLNRQSGLEDMQPITRARVPVIKGTKLRAGNPHHPDGSIDFDICFLNDIAVANSNLLREYSLIDSRVRDVMIQVKRFCKHHKVNSSANGTISSYAWNILCIFYLQCIGFIPNLQDPALMEEVKQKPNPKGNYWHLVDGLDTFYLKWKDVEKVWKRPEIFDTTTVSMLLYGFFDFYNHRFAHGLHTVSIRQGSMNLSKLHGRTSSYKNPKIGRRLAALSIEDPFEHYESDRPHDLGSHSYNDDEIMNCLTDGEQRLQKLLVHGVTEELSSPWMRSNDVGEENEKQPGGKKIGQKKNQGGGNQANGGHGKNNKNRNRNNNRNRKPKQPNQPADDKKNITIIVNNDRPTGDEPKKSYKNPNGKKKPQQRRRRNGPKKPQGKGPANGSTGKDQTNSNKPEKD